MYYWRTFLLCLYITSFSISLYKYGKKFLFSACTKQSSVNPMSIFSRDGNNYHQRMQSLSLLFLLMSGRVSNGNSVIKSWISSSWNLPIVVGAWQNTKLNLRGGKKTFFPRQVLRVRICILFCIFSIESLVAMRSVRKKCIHYKIVSTNELRIVSFYHYFFFFLFHELASHGTFLVAGFFFTIIVVLYIACNNCDYFNNYLQQLTSTIVKRWERREPRKTFVVKQVNY